MDIAAKYHIFCNFSSIASEIIWFVSIHDNYCDSYNSYCRGYFVSREFLSIAFCGDLILRLSNLLKVPAKGMSKFYMFPTIYIRVISYSRKLQKYIVSTVYQNKLVYNTGEKKKDNKKNTQLRGKLKTEST